MKKVMIFAFLLNHLYSCVTAQPVKKDSALIKRIDSMFYDDQFWRKEYIKINKKERSEYDAETIEKRWAISDIINEVKAKDIVNKYSYPGYDLVGEISDDFWAIVQHCDDDIPFQERVLALMKVQIAKNNASKTKYAYLVDRILVNKNEKQIYGTQLQRDDKTGKFSPFPLKYPVQTVDKLRKEVGFRAFSQLCKRF